MGQGYLKFKRRAVSGAWIKACIFGLALGLAVAAGWLLVDKLMNHQLQMLWYGIAGGGVAVLSAAWMLLGIFPTDRRLAKRLDRALALDEKVQTMVAYRQDDTPMVQLQREDTDSILSATPVRRAMSKRWWMNGIAPIVALALAVTAVLVPVSAEVSEPVTPDPVFQLSEWQEMALKQLIDEVKISNMEAAPKGQTVECLERLLIDVKNATKESVMKHAVVDAIVKIHGIVKDHNTYLQIGGALNASGAETLRSWGLHVIKGDPAGLSRALGATRETLVGVGLQQALTSLTDALTSALSGTALDAADPLYRGLATLNETLRGIADAVDGMTDAAVTEALDLAFKAADGSLSGAVQQQRFNEVVRDNVIVTLMAIFGITAEDLPSEVLPSDRSSQGKEDDDFTPGENDDDEVKDNGGGLGDGEQLFGSNDFIYDPDENDYVFYGDVITKYEAKISQMRVDGSLSEEMDDMISDYFTALKRKMDGET